MRKELIVNVKNKDFDYRARAGVIIVLAIELGIKQYQQQFYSSGNYAVLIAAIVYGIILFVESRKPLEICDNGMFFPDRFIDWDDIVDFKWDSMFNKKYERLTITSKRRPAFLGIKEYDLRMKIPTINKCEINDVLSEKAKSIV
jgi:hypothetical protein